MIALLFFSGSPVFAFDLDEASAASGSGESVEHPRLEFQLDYLQSTQFWSAINELLNINGDTLKLQDVLQSNYGQNEDAAARFTLGLYDLPTGSHFSLLEHFYFLFNGELACTGIIENPVISELHGDAVALAGFSLGTTGHLPSTSIKTKIGLTAGAGQERKSDLIGPDLDETLAVDRGNVRMIGFDLGAALASDPSRLTQIGTSIEDHGTYFATDLQGDLFANRWKSYSFVQVGNTAKGGGISIKPHFVMGPQPLPVDILPRSWDLLHRESTSSDFRAWSGEGIELGFFAFQKVGVTAEIGFYGGYVGGDASARLGSLFVKIGAWGLSLGPTYLAQSERLYSGAFGVSF